MLSQHDLTITSGNFGDTGVGGLATAGGVGYFARSQGLTIDRIRRIKVTTADGHVRWVDAEHEPDLFWALRGGATQAGIAVEFVFEATPMHSRGDATIVHQSIQYLIDDLPRFTREWGEWIEAAPREAESFLMLQRGPGGGAVVQGRTVWAGDDVAAAEPTLRAAFELGQVIAHEAHALPYAEIVPSPGGPHVGQQRIHMRDVLVDTADEEVGAALEQSLADPLTLVGELRALGGAVSDTPADATAWAGRTQRALAGTRTQPASVARVDESFAPLQALGTGTYGAYSSDTRASAAALAWLGITGDRLRAIADQYDPEGLFDGGLVLPRDSVPVD